MSDRDIIILSTYRATKLSMSPLLMILATKLSMSPPFCRNSNISVINKIVMFLVTLQFSFQVSLQRALSLGTSYCYPNSVQSPMRQGHHCLLLRCTSVEISAYSQPFRKTCKLMMPMKKMKRSAIFCETKCWWQKCLLLCS